MKIWLMNHYATTMFFDKAGRHYWFAKELENRGHDVTVFCATTILNKSDNIPTEGKKWTSKKTDGTPFVFVKAASTVGNGIDRVRNMGDFFLNLFPATKEYSKQNGRPDVIIASSVHPLTMVAGILIARRMKVPCICEVRDLWPEAIFAFGKSKEKSLLGRILITGEHWIYKNADALIFTKEGDTDYLKEKGWTTAQGGNVDLAKCHYINNGVDMQAFLSRIENDQIDDADLENGFNVVYAGTIRPVNNVGNLLDAAKIIAKMPEYRDIRFLIYGEGSEAEKLRQRIKEEAIDNVVMKGFVERRFIPYILSKSSVNILNYSQKEYNWTRGNSSNKLFEYMASGKPVISTVKMGYSIIKKYQCGIELDECTPEALAKAIIDYRQMPREEYEKIGSNAREGARQFDFNVLTDKLIGVIKEVSK